LLRLILLLGVAGAGLLLLRMRGSGHAKAAQTPAKDGARPVPVTVATAERREVPIWLEGLGTAAAWQQATVRSQIDGRLDRVFFTEGQAVHKGDLLAQIDERPYLVQLHQAEGALVRDQAQLNAAQLDLKRYKELTDNKFIAPQQFDQQKGTVGQAQGAVQVSTAALESARLNLEYCKIRAPFDGVVGVRLVDAGNYVRASDTTGIVVLTQLDPAALIFTLPEDDLPQVVAAQRRGAVPVEAYSRDGAQLLGKGSLGALDNQISQATATLRLKAIVPNPDRVLWPNEFVKVRMHVDTLSDALVVPLAAVQRGPQGTFVYVVSQGQKAQPQPIALQRTLADMAVLEGGVAPGARVITEGQSQLRPGSPVQIARGPGAEPKPGAQHADAGAAAAATPR
jgi:multidrug efflux system membrane fusion protein